MDPSADAESSGDEDALDAFASHVGASWGTAQPSWGKPAEPSPPLPPLAKAKAPVQTPGNQTGQGNMRGKREGVGPGHRLKWFTGRGQSISSRGRGGGRGRGKKSK